MKRLMLHIGDIVRQRSFKSALEFILAFYCRAWDIVGQWDSIEKHYFSFTHGFWWTLCKVTCMDQFSFSYITAASYTSTIYWRCFLFSSLYFWIPGQRLSVSFLWFYFLGFNYILLKNLFVSIPLPWSFNRYCTVV